jgi:hypothetical protein
MKTATKCKCSELLRILSILFLLANCQRGYSQNATNQATDPERAKIIDRILHKDLLKVHNFQQMQVSLDGSAEDIGLNHQDLQEFVTLKFKNIFTGYELKKLPDDALGPMDENGDILFKGVDKNEWALLTVNIWTVGTNYPVAYHLKLTIGRLGGGCHGYEDQSLGYATAKNLRETRQLKDSITDMMERAATELMKLQGKL